MSDMSSTIASFASPYTVKRRAGSFVGGRWTESAPTTFSIDAVFQPLSGRELQRLSQGEQTTELRKGFTGTKLNSSQAGGAPADLVVIDGEDWEVQNVQPWDALGNYFRVIVAKVRR